MTDLLEPSGTNGSPKATEAKSVRIWPRSEDASSGSTKPTTPPSWFKDCQPLRIEVTPALVLVRFEWTDEGRKGYLEDWKLELRKLGRGVGQCAAASNLQRPVVLAIEESDGNRFTKLQKLSADQEWHRGDFALWPLEPGGGSGPTSNDGATPRGFEWLLEPTVQGLVYAENERSTRVEDGAIAEKFADELKRAEKGSVAALVERLFDKIKTLREEGEGTALTESEVAEVDAVTEQWFDDELTRRERERKRLDEAAPAPALSDSGELPRLIVESYGGSKLHSQKATLYFGADDDEQARKAWKTQSEEFLTEFRNRVRGLRPPKLTVDAQCTPAAAMFVGSWFHAATRIHLVAIQHNQRTNTEEAWQRVPGRAIDAYELQSDVQPIGGDPEELQVRISIARDVSEDADAWTHGSATRSAICLNLRIGDPSSSAVRNEQEACAIARAVREAILRARQPWGSRLPLRLFYAGPAALALFLGAELNAMGRVLLMDWHKTLGRYVESFDYSPGN